MSEKNECRQVWEAEFYAGMSHPSEWSAETIKGTELCFELFARGWDAAMKRAALSAGEVQRCATCGGAKVESSPMTTGACDCAIEARVQYTPPRHMVADSAKHDCCANCMRPEREHSNNHCPHPFTTVWHAWDYDSAPGVVADSAGGVEKICHACKGAGQIATGCDEFSESICKTCEGTGIPIPECNGEHDYGVIAAGAKECTACSGEHQSASPAALTDRERFEAWHNRFYGPQDKYNPIRSLAYDSCEVGMGYDDPTVQAQFVAFCGALLAAQPPAAAEAEKRDDRKALTLAAVNCPHEIDSNRMILHYDSKQAGPNALAQLVDRLCAAMSAGTAPKEGA